MNVTVDQNRWGARIQIDDVPAGAATYTITRTSPRRNTAAVRGKVHEVATSPPIVVRDWEVPLGIDLTYIVTFYDANSDELETQRAVFRAVWIDCDAWLVDIARPTNSLAVTIESMNELAFQVSAGVHHVLNRRAPVMTTLPAWTPETELDVLTVSLQQRDQVRNILGSGYPFLLRTNPVQGVGNMYLGLTDFVEERFLTLGDRPERRFRISAVQVERPDPTLFAPTAPMTYQILLETWPTYQDLDATDLSYDELAYTWPDQPDTSPVVPWLPDDI